jgi:hypothetical protein
MRGLLSKTYGVLKFQRLMMKNTGKRPVPATYKELKQLEEVKPHQGYFDDIETFPKIIHVDK